MPIQDFHSIPLPTYEDEHEVWPTTENMSSADCTIHGANLELKSVFALDLNLQEFSTCLQTQPTKKAFIKFYQTDVCERFGLDFDRRIQDRNDQDMKINNDERLRICLNEGEWKVTQALKRYLVNNRKTFHEIRKYRNALNLLQDLKYIIPERLEIEKFLFAFSIEVLTEHCKDSHDITMVLKELLSSDIYYESFFFLCDALALDYFLLHALRTDFDLFGAMSRPNYEYEGRRDDFTNSVIEVNGDPGIIEVLSDYDFPMEKMVVMDMDFLLYQLVDGMPFEDCVSFRPDELLPRRKMFCLQVMNYYWMITLQLIKLEDAVRCLELIWDSIPDPYLTSKEIIQCMEESSSPEWREFDEYKKSLLDVCFLYDRIAPKIATRPLQPRSLMHLSRCAIRKRLISLETLYIGPDDLQLPPLLPEYIRLL